MLSFVAKDDIGLRYTAGVTVSALDNSGARYSLQLSRYFRTMASSPAPAESLAQELLDEILSYLSCASIARLSQCSQRLYGRLEPMLYGREQNRHLAMKWACENGCIPVIDRAISYGSSASVVTITKKPPPSYFEPRPSPGFAKILTLQLAAKHNQVEAFRHLLTLGATLKDQEVHPLIKRALMRQLCKPTNNDLLRPFLRAGLASQLDAKLRNDALVSVLSCPGNDPSLDLVDLLLDNNADPNHIYSSRKASWSPLSASLVLDRPDIFHSLLQRGAKIQEPPDLYRQLVTILPLHVPIYAALYSLARHRTRNSLQLCLDHGADINLCIYAWSRNGRKIHVTTPLRFFLDTLFRRKQLIGPEDMDNLRHLYALGLTLETRPIPEHPALQTGAYRLGAAPSHLKLNLDNLFLRSIIDPSAIALLELLIKKGDLKVTVDTAKLLAKEDRDQRRAVDPAILRTWQTIVDMILADVSHREELDNFFYTYITTKGSNGGNELGDLGRTTVARMRAFGADVNARKPSDGKTALHSLCYNRFFSGLRIGFLRFLVDECGMDTQAKWNDETPAQMMLRHFEMYSSMRHYRWIMEWEKESVNEAIAILQIGSSAT